MSGPPPFVLLPRDDGRHELRAFSDDSEDPVVLVLDAEDGRRFGVAVADMLTALDAGVDRLPIRMVIDGRDVKISGTADGGLRVTVGR